LLSVIAAFIVIAPAFVPSWKTDAVQKGIPGALEVIFEYGVSNQVTSVALIVSAIIQAKAFYLSGYHADIVLNLSWILTLSMWCSLLTAEIYEWKNDHSLKHRATATASIGVLGAILKGAFGLWVFISPGSFQSGDGTCDLENPVKFYMFGKDFNTGTPSFRHFWKATYILALLYYGSIFFTFLTRLMGTTLARDGPPQSNSDPESRPRVTWRTHFHWEQHSVTWSSLAAGVIIAAVGVYLFPFIALLSGVLFGTIGAVRSRIQMRVMEVNMVQSPPHVKMNPFRLLCFFLVPAGSVVGFIISTELTIKANAGLLRPGENLWSLAQTLAVFLVLPNAYMVFKCARVMAKALWKQGSRGTSLSDMVEEGSRDEKSQHTIDPQVPGSILRRMSV